MSNFSSDVLKYTLQTAKGFDQFRRAVVLSLFKGVIMDTPVDTGRLRANWQVTLDAPAVGTKDGVDKTGTVTVATILPNLGEMDQAVYLTNNLPYAFGIEYLGASKEKAPEGMVRRNVLRVQRNINKLAIQHLKT